MTLLSGQYRQEARQVSSAMTCIGFSRNAHYMDEFTSALFLPHANLAAFPGVSTGR